MTVVGYYKIGRSIQLDPSKLNFTSGDEEAWLLLQQLATTYPNVEWQIVGKNTGQDPQSVGLPANVVNPWFKAKIKKADFDATCDFVIPQYVDCDYLVGWVGQHSNVNIPLPKLTDRSQLTHPLVCFLNYAGPVIKGINAWRDKHDGQREEVWLNPDIRNTLKTRDLKWPHSQPLYAFAAYEAKRTFERYGDDRDPKELGFDGAYWVDQYRWGAVDHYHDIDLTVVSEPPTKTLERVDWEDKVRFGILTSQQGPHPSLWRPEVFRDWVVPNKPDFFHGRWTPEGAAVMGIPVPEFFSGDEYLKFSEAKSTFQTCSSGAPWVTPKFWEACQAGVVSFLHPSYDAPGNVVPTLEQVRSGAVEDDELAKLALFLRVENPDQLGHRLDAVDSSRGLWEWIVGAQKKLYDRTWSRQKTVRTIGQRIGVVDAD